MSFFQPKTAKPSAPNHSSSSNTPFIGVRAKLNIGESNDKYEKEADAVADKVVQKRDFSERNLSSLLRLCT